jgi:hypothetical protein
VATANSVIIRVLIQDRIKHNFKITDKLNSRQVLNEFLTYLEWFHMQWDQIIRAMICNKLEIITPTARIARNQAEDPN